MSKIKPPEIKSGDALTSDSYNEVFNAFGSESISLGKSNFKSEALNRDVLSKGAVFSRPKREVELDSWTITDEALNSYVSPGSGGNYMRAHSREPLTAYYDQGTDLIVRASCNITMKDFGARTFRTGWPVVIGLGLYYSTHDFGDDPGVAVLWDKPKWSRAEGTFQRFSCAFSSKIPSASYPDREAFLGDGSLLLGAGSDALSNRFASGGSATAADETYRWLDTRQTRASGDTTADSYAAMYDINSNPYMYFDYDFDYNVVYRFHDFDYAGDIKFALLGSSYDRGGIQGTEALETASSPKDGCGQVKYNYFQIKNTMISSITHRG